MSEERVMAPLAALLAERPTLRAAEIWVVSEGTSAAERLTDAERPIAIVLHDSPP